MFGIALVSFLSSFTACLNSANNLVVAIPSCAAIISAQHLANNKQLSYTPHTIRKYRTLSNFLRRISYLIKDPHINARIAKIYSDHAFQDYLNHTGKSYGMYRSGIPFAFNLSSILATLSTPVSQTKLFKLPDTYTFEMSISNNAAEEVTLKTPYHTFNTDLFFRQITVSKGKANLGTTRYIKAIKGDLRRVNYKELQRFAKLLADYTYYKDCLVFVDKSTGFTKPVGNLQCMRSHL